MPMHNTDQYTIKIKQFEGPFDLLLFFIERDEIDIMDIPISQITDDFLEYIRTLEMLNIDVASEFILVAATLMRIKAKMLLPRPEVNELGEILDPREELARKLIEYKRFKDILQDLQHLESERRLIATRGNTKTEIKIIAEKALVDADLQSLTMYRLFKAFEHAMNRYEVRKKKPDHIIYRYEYNIAEQKIYIKNKIGKKVNSSFTDIFGDMRDRLQCIVTFLSLLELINNEEVRISTGIDINSFTLELIS